MDKKVVAVLSEKELLLMQSKMKCYDIRQIIEQ